MNPNARTPGHTAPNDPTPKPLTTVSSNASDNGPDDAEVRRQIAALTRSGAEHEARSAAALGDADAARGRAEEAAGRGDLATAGAEWSDAAGLDGLSAHEATGADVDARAAAAAATSPSVAPSKGKSPRNGKLTVPVAGGRGASRQPSPPTGGTRRNIP